MSRQDGTDIVGRVDEEQIRQLVAFLRLESDKTEVLGLWEVVIALSLSLLCSVVVARVYRRTHRGPSYSQSFAQTLVLTSIVTTIVMIVIGSNIARAFSLVGALSIIRFRNAVKETRDVGFIFFAMAIAMANGTRFYGVAVLGTAFVAGVMLLFQALDFGASKTPAERLLRVELAPGADPEVALAPALRALFDAWSLVRLETVRGGLHTEALLSVRPKPGVTPARVLEELTRLNDNLPVSYAQETHTDDL